MTVNDSLKVWSNGWKGGILNLPINNFKFSTPISYSY